jgi:putative polyketide hydroxylase
MTSTTDSRAGERVPVLIAGGSLVGLSASLFLGRLGIRHTLVERHARTSHHPRGRGNNVRTMELFRTAGIEPAIREAASVLAGNHGILQAHTLTGGPQEWLFRQIDPGGRLARISPSGWCLCSQNDLEPVLLECARDLGGDIRFGTELMSAEQDADGVTAVIRDRGTGRDTTVRADYLIAADGPRSPSRERLGIPMTGPGDLFHNVSITFRADRLADAVGDQRFIVCYLTNPESPGALLPVDNERDWVFHAPWRPDTGETLEDFTDERCADLIRTATGVPDLEVHVTGKAPWHAAERTAARYGRGRIFLAGDSAHEMSPTGAFGSNTGIQDAHNLAWKLAAVLRGWAGPGLLETYDPERRAVALATGARASARSAEHSHPGYDVAPSGGPQAGMLAVVLGYRYRTGAVEGADADAPVIPEDFRPVTEPGGRAPHMWVHRAGRRLSTLDLYEQAPVLLCGSDAGDWYRAGVRVAERTGVPLECYRMGEDLVPEGGGEEAPDWARLHGTTDEGAVLVRPDGFTAWVVKGPDEDHERTLEGVLDRVFRRG